MKELMTRTLWLQLMAEGGDGGAPAGDGPGAPEGEGQNEAEAAPDLHAEFDALVNKGGKYAEIYQERFRGDMQKRMRGTNQMRERLNAMTPMLEMLASRYDTTVDDPKLIEMVAGDKSLLADKALRNNLSEDQQYAIDQGRAAEMRARAMIQQMQADQQMAQWEAEAEALKAKYPSFDLETELQNPTFRQLLMGNVTMEGAIMALHHNEIIPAAMQYTAKEAKKQAAQEVAAGQKRPRENGSGSQAAAQTAVNVANMSRAEVREYMKRVERGERISFG